MTKLFCSCRQFVPRDYDDKCDRCKLPIPIGRLLGLGLGIPESHGTLVHGTLYNDLSPSVLETNTINYSGGIDGKAIEHFDKETRDLYKTTHLTVKDTTQKPSRLGSILHVIRKAINKIGEFINYWIGV